MIKAELLSTNKFKYVIGRKTNAHTGNLERVVYFKCQQHSSRKNFLRPNEFSTPRVFAPRKKATDAFQFATGRIDSTQKLPPEITHNKQKFRARERIMSAAKRSASPLFSFFGSCKTNGLTGLLFGVCVEFYSLRNCVVEKGVGD